MEQKSIIYLSVNELEEFIHKAISCHLPKEVVTPTPLLTAKEVASILKCSPRTIYNYKEQGLLRSVDITGLVRFRLQDVETLIATHSK